MSNFSDAIRMAGGPSNLARKLGVSPTAVGFWRDGKRNLPAELGADIEAATGGAVRRWHLWPSNWHRIWPELVRAEGAPAIPGGNKCDHTGREA